MIQKKEKQTFERRSILMRFFVFLSVTFVFISFYEAVLNQYHGKA